MSHRRSLPKRLASVLLLFSMLAAVCTPALAHTNAQVPQAKPAARAFAPTITKTVGGGGDYATLKAAFDDINAGTLTGAIQLDVIGDTTETAPAVLNASGSGSASYTSVLIQPSGGAARTISGAIVAASPLIDLNGADYVTFDGLNSGGNTLTIANTTVSATSGTSTIRFQADATNNTVTNSNIQGAATMAVGTNGGTIYFGAGAISTGNDNNTISYNNIGPVGSNLPSKAVFSNGTTTSTATYNSGNVVTNNNIFDFFGAAVQSAGFYMSSGTTDCTISNNRLYQTGTRTQTTAAIHAGIQLASSNINNCTISGNTIGYASAAGTGTYDFVGFSSSSKFIPIYFSTHGTTTASSVQGNTITAISLSGIVGGTGTSSAFVGISVGSGLVNIGNVTGNTIGSLTTAGAISVSSNNASAFDVRGIYFFPSASVNISNNTVGGITAANSGAGAINLIGIHAYTGTTYTNVMSNNTVGSAAAPLSNSASSTSSTTIGIRSQSGITTMTGNSVNNLTMSAGNVGTGSVASVIGLWVDGSSVTSAHNIAQNTVHSLSNTNASAAVWVTGLQFNGSTSAAHTVQRNLIYNLSTPSSSATATVNGINVQGGTTTYQNNMIALGNDMTANSPQINGMAEVVAGTDNFYHNSVYIGGAAVVAGTANSYAFQSTITTNTRNYRDNIFYNGRSNGAATGKHYAVRVGGAAPNPTGLTINNNVYLANGTGAVFGYFNSLDVANLAAWQTAVGQDANSFESDPQYLAPTAAAPDLHINGSIVTVIEGNGFPIGTVTDDYDGQTRASLTPTDIGADAGDFMGADMAPPAITYTALGNTASTADRILAATIADVTGVPTSGALQPRIYYKKGAGGTWYSSQGVLTSGSGTSGAWDFTIVAADMGGVAAGDTIFYYVIAQDTAGTPNIGSNPAGVVATDVNTVITPPAVPNSYNVLASISGTYDVGATCATPEYATITAAVTALNAGVLTGPTTYLLCDTTYPSETFPITIVANAGSSAVNTVTIKPAPGVLPTVSGSNTTAIFDLNGATYVTLDGLSTMESPPGKDWTIENTSTSGATIRFINGASNNTVKNTVVQGVVTSSTNGVVFFSTSSAAAGNNSNLLQNNDLRGGATMPANIFYNSGTSGKENTANTVAGNRIFDFSTAGINDGGNSSGNAYTGNEIFEVTSQTTAVYGFYPHATTIVGFTFSGNYIHDLTTSGTTVYGIYLYDISSAVASVGTVVNNFISLSPTTPTALNGIYDLTAVAEKYDIYHNSVYLGGTASGASNSVAYRRSINSITNFKNNILVNARTDGTGKHYAIQFSASVLTGLTADYNDIYNTGGVANFFGHDGTAEWPDLASWQVATGKDANSVSGDPLFLSSLDLHLFSAASPASNAGTPIGSVTTDYDGEARDGTTPEIGADELTVAATATPTPTPTDTPVPPTATPTPTPTDTPVPPTATPTPTPTDTPVPPTDTPTPTPTDTPVPPTDTPTPTPTDTPVPPTDTPTPTPTDTPVPPTDTPTPTPTDTPVAPTATPTDTPVAPTATPTDTPVAPTATPTDTPVAPTATPTDTPVAPTATPTDTPVAPTATPTDTPMPPTATPTDTPMPPTATPTDTPVPPTATPTPTATSAPATPTPTRTPTPTSVPGSPVLTFFTANGFTVASVNYSGFTPGVTYRLKVFRSVDTTVSVGDMGLGFVDFVSATSSGVFNFPIGDGNNFPLGAGINFPATDPGFDYYLLAQLRESSSTAVFYGIYHLPASPVFVHGSDALADRVTVLSVSTAEIADGVRVKLGNPSFTYATGDVTGINIHTYAGNEFISAVSLAAPIALTVYAGDGNDTVITGSGADIIRGGAGSDVLNGQGGADSITGDAGNDTLYAGGGCGGDGAVDRLDGGADTDTAYHVGAGDRLFNIETIIGC